MKIPINLHLSGDLETSLDKISLTLAQIEEGLEPTLERDLLEAARFVKTMAQIRVRVDTGSLLRSIRIERIRRLAVRVRAGGYIVNPKTNRLVDYAVYVEKRYPFLRPSWEDAKRFVKAKVKESMLRLAM